MLVCNAIKNRGYLTDGGSGGGWMLELSGLTFDTAERLTYYMELGHEAYLNLVSSGSSPDAHERVNHMNGASMGNTWFGGYACLSRMEHGDAYGGFGGGGAACVAGGGGGGYIGGKKKRNDQNITRLGNGKYCFELLSCFFNLASPIRIRNERPIL